MPLVDARGKACPMPIVMLAAQLRRSSEAWLWADDPATGADLDAFCAAGGHEVVEREVVGRLVKARVRRAHERSV